MFTKTRDNMEENGLIHACAAVPTKEESLSRELRESQNLYGHCEEEKNVLLLPKI
jgi:hypothetical protein